MQPLLLMVVGGLVFSAKTVYEWTRTAFHCRYKAVGFVVLLEGVMVLASSQWLTIAALVYLIVINGIGTGVRLGKAQEN